MRRFERGDQKQLRIGEVRVEEIPFDPKSRDDIPAILRGLKALYCDGESRDRLFELLERHLGEKRDCDLSRGRRGMELWSMVVLALLKEGLNCDFDRLHRMANHDGLIRLMLGHTSLDAEAYHRQALIDNVSLVTPQLIGEISRLVLDWVTRWCEKSLAPPYPGGLTHLWWRPMSPTPRMYGYCGMPVAPLCV